MTTPGVPRIPSNVKNAITIGILWIFVSLFNLTKAVHIDDTAYIEIARHIVSHPFQPMSGELFWGRETVEPIHHTNQPHLLFYGYALVFACFGESIPLLHVFLAVFSLGAIVCFFRLAKMLDAPCPVVLTAAFCLGPVFIPSQNLMTDIPLAAFWLGSMWLITKIPPSSATAGLLAAAACLTKYTGLVLLPLTAIHLGFLRQWRRLAVLFVPITAIICWSIFNYVEYGSIHILNRSIREVNVRERTVAWIICLGAIAPFSIAFIPYILRRRQRRVAVLLAIAISAGFACNTLNVYMAESKWQSLLRIVFFENGCVIVAVSALRIIEALRSLNTISRSPVITGYVTPGAWLVGAAVFIILFAPFIAVRHFLLVIPPLLLLNRDSFLLNSTRSRVATLTGMAATVLLGAVIGVSDWYHADTYRRTAAVVASRYATQGNHMWYVGHWGWQWYASDAGMTPYDMHRSSLRENDIIVSPDGVEKQRLNRTGAIRFETIDTVVIPASPTTRVRTMVNKAGLYSSSIQYLPWTISREPLETFRILRVTGR